MKYDVTIGIEVHVQLKTASKMFCSCKLDMDQEKANSNICPICLGLPGSLPAINKRAVELGVKFGLATNSKINLKSRFDRKNYFYPDLPKAYQITQLFEPICEGGSVECFDGSESFSIELDRAHLEEDAAKLIHPNGKKYTLVDFNRAGSPLLEIVTKPVIKSPKQARLYLEALHQLVVLQNICNGSLQKGQFKFDLNISLSKTDELGSKVELKNLNSFRFAEKALEYEIKRQSELLDRGESIISETRGYNENKNITISQRVKEQSMDYRYFPEPDLPEVVLTASFIDNVESELVTGTYELIKELLAIGIDIETINKILINEVLRTFTLELIKSKVNNIGQIINFIYSSYNTLQESDRLKINRLDAKSIVDNFNDVDDKRITLMQLRSNSKLVLEGNNICRTLKDSGSLITLDDQELENIIKESVSGNIKAWEDYLAGNTKALGAIVGPVMKKTKGSADPKLINEIINKLKSADLS